MDMELSDSGLVNDGRSGRTGAEAKAITLNIELHITNTPTIIYQSCMHDPWNICIV